MTVIYLAAALFGGIFLVPMLLGGLDIDADVDVDLDVGPDIEFGAGSDGGFRSDVGDISGGEGADFAPSSSDVGGIASFVASLLSFRSLVFFIAFFGIAGLILTLLGSGRALTLVTAVVLGLFAAALHAQLFAVLGRSNTSSALRTSDIEGHAARVVLPINGITKGRIRADIGGQPTFLVAQSYSAEHSYDVGESVVVVSVENGTALVAALDL